MPESGRLDEGSRWILLAWVLLLPVVPLGIPGCTTRGDTPVLGADSTWVYPSKLPNDISASITFQLKDSAKRDEEKRQDKERSREISRLKKTRSGLLALGREQEKQRILEAKRKAKAEEKAKKSKKGKKGTKGREASGKSASSSTGSAAMTPASGGSAAGAPRMSSTALRDSLAAVDTRIAMLQAEDSLASLAAWKQRGPDGRPADERSVDLEEGARVLAVVRLENVYARGTRPLMFHIVWLNTERKRVFKKMTEYMPNDSVRTLVSSLTLSPEKRSAGHYTVEVFLFREEIAEKSIELRGKGIEEKEQGGEEGM